MIPRVFFLTLGISLSVSAQSFVGLIPYTAEEGAPRDQPLDVGLLLSQMTNAPMPEVDTRLVRVLTPDERDWLQRLDAATTAGREGRFQEAIQGLETCIAQRPEERMARLTLADTLYSAKEYRRSIALYEALIEEYPQDFMAANNLAWLLSTADDLSVRDGERAVGLARNSVVRAPVNYHVWSTYSESLYISGRYEEALDAARQAVELARRQEASDHFLTYYIHQVDRSAKAKLATSILE